MFRLDFFVEDKDVYLQCTGWSAKTVGERAAMQAAANVFNVLNILIKFQLFFIIVLDTENNWKFFS